MNILLLPGTYDCKNLGDVAMLQVAVARLKALWPEAGVHVLTFAPEALRRHCPEALAAPLRGRDRWLKARLLPRWLLPAAEHRFRRRFPDGFARLWNLKQNLFPLRHTETREFLWLFAAADLLVMAGCGVLNDQFPAASLRILDTFEMAFRRSLPTVMLSQGIGPFADPELDARARAVLPRVDHLFIRETAFSLPLLERLGVPAARVTATGDDALEPAWCEAASTCGQHLGVNLRVARYSGLDETARDQVGRWVKAKAAAAGVELLGLPIARDNLECDVRTLETLLRDFPGVKDSGAALETPAQVIRQTARCRVVVTGSYHAGVFALAQGIPVLGVTRGDYYHQKFSGLAAQFGKGCAVLSVDDPGFGERFAAEFDRLWREAAALRPALREAASRQIKLAQAAYASLSGLPRRHAAPLAAGGSAAAAVPG